VCKYVCVCVYTQTSSGRAIDILFGQTDSWKTSLISVTLGAQHRTFQMYISEDYVSTSLVKVHVCVWCVCVLDSRRAVSGISDVHLERLCVYKSRLGACVCVCVVCVCACVVGSRRAVSGI